MPNSLELPHAELRWFHRYPARFAPRTVTQMLRTVHKQIGGGPCTVLDPFAGTGTTLSAARQMGLNAIGVELSALGVLIAQVRLAPPDDLDRARQLAEACLSSPKNTWAVKLPDELVSWLGVRNARRLSHYLVFLGRVKDAQQKRWLQLAISSALRPASRWLPGSIKPQVDPHRKPPPIEYLLRRWSGVLACDCAAERAKHKTGASSVVVKGDATALPFGAAAVDAIVTSPPYETMYDYFDVQRLSYLAFNWPCEHEVQIGRSSGISRDGLGFLPPEAMMEWYNEVYKREETAGGRALRLYLRSMRAHLLEAHRVVRPGGVVAYAIANSVRGQRVFRLVEALAEMMRDCGFVNVRARRRVGATRRILPLGRNPRTGRFSSKNHQVSVDERVIYAVRPH